MASALGVDEAFDQASVGTSSDHVSHGRRR
jgi:hypothetical protein